MPIFRATEGDDFVVEQQSSKYNANPAIPALKVDGATGSVTVNGVVVDVGTTVDQVARDAAAAASTAAAAAQSTANTAETDAQTGITNAATAQTTADGAVSVNTTQTTNIAANAAAIALRPLTTDLASTTHGKGASTIGVEAGATNVEAALAALNASLSALSPGFDIKYKLEASQKLGTENLNSIYLDFLNGADDVAQVIGTNGSLILVGDENDAVNSIGGVIRMGTGTDNAARVTAIVPHVAGTFAPTMSYNNATIKFYRACRFRQITAADANTDSWVGSPAWRMGVIGANSTTHYSLQMKVTGDSPHFITSTIAIDTNFHVLATYHDGVNAWFRVDNEAWISIPDTAFWPISGTVSSYWQAQAGKIGGAVDHQMDIDWGLWVVSPV